MARWWILVTIALVLCAVSAGAQSDPAQPSASPTDPAAAGAEAPPAASTAPPEPAASPTAEPRAAQPVAADLLDQTTPRQSVTGFMRAIEAQRLAEAARYLDLRGLHWGEQTPIEAAEELGEVLRRRVWLELSSVSDKPEGEAEDGVDVERVAVVEVDGKEIPITLSRVRRGGGPVWLFSATTVARIPELASSLGAAAWVAALVPASLEHSRWYGLWSWQWLGILLALVVGFPAGFGAGTLASRLLRGLTLRTTARWDDAVVDHTRGTLRFAVGWLLMGGLLLSLDLPSRLAGTARLLVATPLILLAGWFLVKSIRAITDVYIADLIDDRELQTRGLRTQLVILRKLSIVAVAFVTIAVALMQFDIVRSVGWSLLASAGVAGVALGFAAQKSLGAVIAGLQLSVTQPIRLGDAIVIHGEWGTVEEIALTYVRVKLWDERRLVVPVEKFLTEIFENWSKPGDSLIGVVFLAVDPTAPVQRIREELLRVAADHPAHDGRECLLQLVEVDERRALLRARVSTSDMSACFRMRCDIRERMVAFLQELDGGRYLPRQRVEQIGAVPGDGPGGGVTFSAAG